ncbi:ribokinase [Aerococcaceae bacterium DSM 111020]|nr:ribokinase [Aerococcaceae bacterium DSM 111020]
MVKIGVVGSISTDFVVEAQRRPLVGETVYGNDFGTSFGGKGANQAVAAARLGGEVFMAGSVGDDSFGSSLLNNLQANNIDTQSVKKSQDMPSGSAIITIAEGDNSIIYVAGANDNYKPEDVDQIADLISTLDIVIVQNETPIDSIERLIEYCNHYKVPIIANPAPARAFSSKSLKKIDFLTPNETEFELLYPNEDMEDVLKKNANKLIITLGSKGAVFYDGNEILLVPSYKPSSIEDTTGAGDTFNGALAVAIANNFRLYEAIKFANLAASISIQKKGAQGGSPTIKQMREHEHYEEKWDIK